jgi:AraC family transcriptional regulator, regulatory protein of adaptative response / methylated-DNA-[protein]-cysteine methyltransferase
MMTGALTVASVFVPPAQTDRWKAVANRDVTADGRFVFAVTTTGIYCRPTCPSRRPRRENVRFFDAAADAERAGFRACLRCKPKDTVSPARARLEKARRWLDEHEDATPTLSILARVAGLSAWHLQRSFTRLYGVSPRDYAAARRVGRLKAALRSGASSTDAVYEAGYGSPSRAYAEVDRTLGMTPAAYRAGGADEQIRYGIADSGIGKVLVASTSRGLCRVALGDTAEALKQELEREFPRATLREDAKDMAPIARFVGQHLSGDGSALRALPVDLRGTAFQRRVWKALQRIPRGSTRTYSEIAAAIGQPTASRAVARACAANPLALIVPCHRVVPASGGTGGYRWGRERKARLLSAEGARSLRRSRGRR